MILPLLLLTLSPAQDETPTFRTGTQMVPVRFHVVRDKRYVDDLKPEDIVLLEDGQPRPVSFFEGGKMKRTTPVEIMLLFDISGSIQHDALLETLTYQKALLNTTPNVRVSVWGFASRLFRFEGATRDTAALTAAFQRIADFGPGKRPRAIPLELPAGRKSAQGGSWIYEAVIGLARLGAREADNASRMILVFSDGFQTTDTRVEDAAGVANELGITVYPVAVGHRKVLDKLRAAKGQLQRARLEMKEMEVQEFARLGELTGGRSFEPFQIDPPAVDLILRYLAAQAIFEYVAGFSPPAADAAPRKHKVEVKLVSKATGKLSGGSRTVVH